MTNARKHKSAEMEHPIYDGTSSKIALSSGGFH